VEPFVSDVNIELNLACDPPPAEGSFKAIWCFYLYLFRFRFVCK